MPCDAKGFEVPYYWWTFNMPSDHGEVVLNDVRVPADAVLGEIDRGLEVAQTFLHENRIRQAASSLGAAQYCIDRAVEYAGHRVTFGKPLSVNQAVQWPLVELQTEAQMVRLLVYYAAWELDRNHHLEVSDKVSMATAPTGWCARPPTAPCRSTGASATAATTSPSSTSTVTTVAIGSPRAPRRSRCAGWPSGCSSSASPPADVDSEKLSADLTAVLGPVLGEATEVTDLRVLTGGASRTTWAFAAVTGSQHRALILRTGPPDDMHAGMELEAAVQGAAADAAPVPTILVASDSSAALGNPFLICDEIAGETIVRRIQRRLDDDGRRSLLGQCAAALAAIHRARTDAPGLAPRNSSTNGVDASTKMGDTTATFEWAFRWLAATGPRRPRRCWCTVTSGWAI